MKYVLLSIFAVCLAYLTASFTGGPKPFEGVITYSVTIKEKVAVAGQAGKWERLYGEQMKLYVKDELWKEEYLTNNKTVREIFYAPKEQKRYIRRAGMGGLEIEDASREPSLLQNTRVQNGVAFFAGKQCKTFVYEATSAKEMRELKRVNAAATGKVFFRYSYPETPEYAIDEAFSMGHKAAFREAFFKNFKLPFYAYEYEDDEVTITIAATAVEPKKLYEDFFTVPK